MVGSGARFFAYLVVRRLATGVDEPIKTVNENLPCLQTSNLLKTIANVIIACTQGFL